MIFPDRISSLIQRLEAGQAVTQADVDRVARLQALDLAKAGEDFVREWSDRERQATEKYRSVMESS